MWGPTNCSRKVMIFWSTVTSRGEMIKKIKHPLPYSVKVSPPDHPTTMTTHGGDVLACHSEGRADSLVLI
ncbi:hypothetical protein RclHR1_07960002 [Rhizophagus clarus]|uniref:Uncharacterized protein n=1 Tax=Rhizophagus clarus TaxID=94130 RepID=A0A2Z6RZ39_9GLOM|nr:hypothetical protein RclHR1_07960002 [Rhizophagus clarus]